MIMPFPVPLTDVWIFFVYLAELGFFYTTARFIKAFRQEAIRAYPHYSPNATLIVPCRGVDYGFEENVKAILNQDYKSYSTIFVVDSFDDPAYKLLKKFKGPKARIIKSKKMAGCSGKVAAQLTAVKLAKG